MTVEIMSDEIRTTTHEISKLHRVIEKLKQTINERNSRILAREDEIGVLHAERRKLIRAIDELKSENGRLNSLHAEMVSDDHDIYDCHGCGYRGESGDIELCDSCEREFPPPKDGQTIPCECGNETYKYACPACKESGQFGIAGTEEDAELKTAERERIDALQSRMRCAIEEFHNHASDEYSGTEVAIIIQAILDKGDEA